MSPSRPTEPTTLRARAWPIPRPALGARAVALSLAVSLGTAAEGAEDPVGDATRLLERHRYEQAGRLLEGAMARLAGERRAQAQLVLGTVYLRNASLHEALSRTAAATELEYFDKLLKNGGEGRSRYARLYLAEALFAAGRLDEARRHFERVRADTGVDSRHRAIARIGLGSVLWMQRDAKGARSLWSGSDGAAEVVLARASAQARARLLDAKSLQRALGEAPGREASLRARRYLIELHLAAGAPDRALAVARAGDLGAASHVETFKAARGTGKSIAFYDLALLTGLSQTYRDLARRHLEAAHGDERLRPSAEFYLAEISIELGEHERAGSLANAFLARPQVPALFRDRMRARQALIAYQQGRKAEAERAWTELSGKTAEPALLADLALGCAAAGSPCAKVLERLAQAAEAGERQRLRPLNAALGTYYLRRGDYERAISYMEAGRDKSNKNKIEANDPEMLAGLAEAYYRTKKFSESLEIFFEMSGEFPVVRQIQEAMQGVYAMEQRSAGDVKIF